MEAHKKLFIGGNWKSNNTHAQTDTLISDVLKKLTFDQAKVGEIMC
jgi:triosephosphate isomerase